MALIVEDGTGVIGANTYISLAEAKDFAASRGKPFVGDDLQVEGYVIIAKDYLEGFRGQYSGKKATSTQALQYPRINAFIDGELFPVNAIPRELKNAQCQLCIDCEEMGGDLLPSHDGYAIAAETVDVLKIEYAAGGRLSGSSLPASPQYPKAQAWIDPLLTNSASLISTVRV